MNGNGPESDETPENLKRWLLLDTAATSGLGCNEETCQNTQEVNNESGVIGDGGILDVNHVGTLDGIGQQPFNKNSMENVSCAAKLKDADFDIHWNTKKVDATFVESPHDDLIRKFHQTTMDCIS